MNPVYPRTSPKIFVAGDIINRIQETHYIGVCAYHVTKPLSHYFFCKLPNLYLQMDTHTGKWTGRLVCPYLPSAEQGNQN